MKSEKPASAALSLRFRYAVLISWVSRTLVAALLPTLAQAIDTTIEDLIGEAAQRAKSASKRGPAPKIQQQLERVSALPKAKQRAIAQVLDSTLAQADA